MRRIFKISNYLTSNIVLNFFIFLFLFTVCFFVYFNALNNDFVLDDKFLIVKNFYIKDLSHVDRIFKTDIFHFHPKEVNSFSKYYRPLQSLSYAFDYSLWKLNPAGYRLTNILVHSLNSFLLFLLIYFIFKDKILALLSATFFCLNPIQVCLVTFIAGRSNLLETLFMFLSLVTFIHYSINSKKLDYIFSLLFFVFALFSREGALLLPLFILICAVLLHIDKKKIISLLMPFFFISVLYLIFRNKFMPLDKFDITNLLSFYRISAFTWHIQEYLGQLILPVGFQVLIFGKSIFFKSLIFILSSSILIYLLIKALIFKDRIAIFALAFYFIGLSPIFRLIDILEYFGPILTEHYVYIAAIGFFVYIAHLLIKLYSRSKNIAKISFIILITIYSSLTIINNTNYKDELTFYNHILDVDKNNTLVRVNLGNIFYEKKMFDKAIEQANLVLAVEPNAWDAYLLLGNIFKSKVALNKAEQFYKKVLVLNPQSSEAYNNIGLIYKSQGKYEEALNSFRKAAEINPEALYALQNLADSLFEKKTYDEALVLYKKILELDSRYVEGYIKKGIILAELGHFKDAEVTFKQALRLDANSVGAMKNLGALYGNMGELDKAISFWQKALVITSDDEEIKKNIEKAKSLKESLNK